MLDRIPDDSLPLLIKLSEAFGPSSREEEVGKIIRSEFESIGLPVMEDVFGTIFVTIGGVGTSPAVLVSAHQDEVGFVIRSSGVLPSFAPVGGLNPFDVIGAEVVVRTSDGDLTGVIASEKKAKDIKAQLIASQLSLDDLYIDFGWSEYTPRDLVKKVRVGLMGVFKTPCRIERNLAFGKSFDDRAGVFALLLLARALKEMKLQTPVILAATVQEEIGKRGIEALLQRLKVPIKLGISIDTSSCTFSRARREDYSKLGKGVSISTYDASLATSPSMVDAAAEIAEEFKIPYHFAYTSGAYEAGACMLKLGILSLPLGIPARYIHSPVSIINLDDVKHTVNFVLALIQSLPEERIKDRG